MSLLLVRWCAPHTSNACSALYRTVACIASISGCSVAHMDISSPSCPPFQEDEEWKDFASGEQDLTGLKIQTTLEWVGKGGAPVGVVQPLWCVRACVRACIRVCVHTCT